MSARATLLSGLALVVVGIIGAVWSYTQLMYGFVEIPAHWWSTLATLPLISGVILVAVGLARGRSARS